MTYCPQCRKENPANANFCMNCGTQINDRAASANSKAGNCMSILVSCPDCGWSFEVGNPFLPKAPSKYKINYTKKFFSMASKETKHLCPNCEYEFWIEWER